MEKCYVLVVNNGEVLVENFDIDFQPEFSWSSRHTANGRLYEHHSGLSGTSTYAILVSELFGI